MLRVSAGQRSALKVELRAADVHPVGLEGFKGRFRRQTAKRRAGHRARARYRKQRKAWLRVTRRRFAVLVLACGVVAVGVQVYFDWIDGDQDWVAGCLTGMLIGALIGLRQSPPGRVANWEEGAWGEEMTASELAKLPVGQWSVIHDLPNGQWNFDHVVVNDQTVFLINSKWSTNRLLSIDSKGVHLVNRFDEEQTRTDKSVLPQARRDARDLEVLIRSRTGIAVAVQPVIAWWGQFPDGSAVVNNILVTQGKQLIDHLQRHQGSDVPRDQIVNALRPGRRRVTGTESPTATTPLHGAGR